MSAGTLEVAWEPVDVWNAIIYRLKYIKIGKYSVTDVRVDAKKCSS